MDLFGSFVPGDEFVGIPPGNSGIARLVETNGLQSPLQLQWGPRNEKGPKATDSTRRVTTLQHLYDGLCGDFVKPLNKELKLGQLVQQEDGQKGEVIGVTWNAIARVPVKHGVAINVPFSKLIPVTEFYKGERVYLAGWLGVVNRVIYEYWMVNRFGINCRFILRNGFTEIPNFEMPLAKCYTLRNGQHFELPPHYAEDILWFNLDDSQRLKLREPNCYKDFRVLNSKVLKVGVTWIGKLPESADPEPSSDITGDDLKEIAHFDTFGIAQCLKTNYSCFKENNGLTPSEEYPIMKRRYWKKEVISRLFQEEPMDVDVDTDDEKENNMVLAQATPDSMFRTYEKEVGQIVQRPRLTDGDVVDTIHIQQVAKVAWENNTTSEVMSRELKRLSSMPCQQFRQFVQLKNSTVPDISHGVTVKRNLETKLVQVQWYTRTRVDWPALEPKGEMSIVGEHEIESHPLLGCIKIGELVVKNPSRPTYYLNRNPARAMLALFRFGIVTEIDVSTGAVIIKSVGGSEFVVWPDDIFVLPACENTKIPPIPLMRTDSKPKLVSSGAGGDTGPDAGIPQEQRNSFSADFQLAYERDMQILQSPNHGLPQGTLIRNFADSQHIFSMLVIGPARTPYEDGIFLFDIRLPVTYPTESPSFVLRSTFCNLITHDVDHKSLMDAPFLTGWTGVEKWHQGCTLIDAIVSVIHTIFVPEPAENAINRQHRRFVFIPEISTGSTPIENLYRRGQFNLVVMIEVWDSLIRMALCPTWQSGNWSDVVTAHLTTAFPRLIVKAEEWIQAAESSLNFDAHLARVGYSVPVPIPEGFVQALKFRIIQLRMLVDRETSASSECLEHGPGPTS